MYSIKIQRTQTTFLFHMVFSSRKEPKNSRIKGKRIKDSWGRKEKQGRGKPVDSLMDE